MSYVVESRDWRGLHGLSVPLPSEAEARDVVERGLREDGALTRAEARDVARMLPLRASVQAGRIGVKISPIDERERIEL